MEIMKCLRKNTLLVVSSVWDVFSEKEYFPAVIVFHDKGAMIDYRKGVGKPIFLSKRTNAYKSLLEHDKEMHYNEKFVYIPKHIPEHIEGVAFMDLERDNEGDGD